MWSILIVTLPTQPNAVRLRIWRALKALGCAALRDGAYLLPDEHASALESLAAEVQEHGGTRMIGRPAGRVPATEWMRVTSSASSLVSGYIAVDEVSERGL